MQSAILKIGTFSGPHPTSIKSDNWKDDLKRWPRTESPHILDYLLKSKACDLKDMAAFRSLESYNYLKSGWVGQVLLYAAEADIYYLKGDVTPSQCLSDDAHQAWVCVCVKSQGEVLTAGCSCMAGLGKCCSHAAAILWKIDMANRKGLTGLSCTDVSAKWNQGTKRNIEPSLIKDLKFKKPKPGNEFEQDATGNSSDTSKVLDHFQLDSKEDLLQHYKDNGLYNLVTIPGTLVHHTAFANKSTGLSKNGDVTVYKRPRETVTPTHNHDCPDDLPYICVPCVKFYNDHVCMSEAQIKSLCLKTATQTNSDLWFESRKLRITASTAAKVPKTEKGNPSKFIFSHVYKPFRGNNNTRYGAEKEKQAINQFTLKTGLIVNKCGTVVAKNENWLSASPDGLIEEDSIIEVKCPVPKTFVPSNADLAFSNGSFHLNSKGSRGYYCQVQLTMFCTGRKSCYFYVWLSDSEDYLLLIQYDEKFVHELVQRLRKFYFTHMLPKLVDDVAANIFLISDAYKKLMEEVQ